MNCNLLNLAVKIWREEANIFRHSPETKPTCGISSCCEGSESMAHGVSKDLTREPSYCTGSRKRLQSTDASFFIQQPIVDNYVFPSTTNEYGLIGFDCEDSMSSSSVDQSKSKENLLVSDDFVATFRSGVEIDPGLKLNPDSCFNGKDSLPIELLLPDEDSLITVDDFRFTPDKEDNTMLVVEGIPVKADRVSSISPVDTCRKLTGLNIFKNERSTQLSSEGSEQNACKSPAQFHQAQPKQFHPLDSQPIQAHKRSQMKTHNLKLQLSQAIPPSFGYKPSPREYFPSLSCQTISATAAGDAHSRNSSSPNIWVSNKCNGSSSQ